MHQGLGAEIPNCAAVRQFRRWQGVKRPALNLLEHFPKSALNLDAHLARQWLSLIKGPTPPYDHLFTQRLSGGGKKAGLPTLSFDYIAAVPTRRHTLRRNVFRFSPTVALGNGWLKNVEGVSLETSLFWRDPESMPVALAPVG